jgi:mRNA interferase MazF
VKTGYLPDTGDLVWLTLNPQAGREQAERRPALVLSPGVYNAKAGLALVCPITNQRKGYPFEVAVPSGCGATGVILADQVKIVDWKARLAEKLGRCPPDTVEEVRARLAPLLGY